MIFEFTVNLNPTSAQNDNNKKRSQGCGGSTCPALFQLRHQRCRAPPRNRTHTHPESPG